MELRLSPQDVLLHVLLLLAGGLDVAQHLVDGVQPVFLQCRKNGNCERLGDKNSQLSEITLSVVNNILRRSLLELAIIFPKGKSISLNRLKVAK